MARSRLIRASGAANVAFGLLAFSESFVISGSVKFESLGDFSTGNYLLFSALLMVKSQFGWSNLYIRSSLLFGRCRRCQSL